MSRDLFANVGPDKCTTLFSNKRYVLRGQPVFSAGDAPDHLFLIQAGQAELSHKWDKRTAIDARPDGPKPIFGVLESLSETKFDSSLTAVTDCEIGLVKAKDFFDVVRSSPELSFRLAEVAAGLYVQMLRTARTT